jgi:hypothetical protein
MIWMEEIEVMGATLLHIFICEFAVKMLMLLWLCGLLRWLLVQLHRMATEAEEDAVA